MGQSNQGTRRTAPAARSSPKRTVSGSRKATLDRSAPLGEALQPQVPRDKPHPAAPDGSSKTIVDPKSSEQQTGPNQTAKDTVPPATDKSESTRAGTQEPSAKAGEATQNDKGYLRKAC